MTVPIFSIFLSVLVSFSMVVGAGDLEPAGAPGATMKTLDEVEPRIPLGPERTPGNAEAFYVISEPGSYYLPGEIFIAGRHGIKIAADHVTLDLMGYRIRSSYNKLQPPANLDFDGINIYDNGKDIEIKNGIIESAKETIFAGFRNGIYSQRQTFPNEISTESLRIINIRVSGSREDGIATGGCYSTIQNCHLIDNGQHGIDFDKGIITNCVVKGNQNIGIVSTDSMVSYNHVSNNGGTGIGIGANSVAINNTIFENGFRGIHAHSNCLIQNNSVSDNSSDGIYAYVKCKILDNICNGNGKGENGGAGIYAYQYGNTVSGNQVSANDCGIEVENKVNLVVKNTASSNNKDYDIIAGNKVGTITSDPTTAGPWDNFSY